METSNTSLHLLPTRTAGAAENMALDFLLLQRYPMPEAVRFRHYDWRGPSVTFGYGQKIMQVREQFAGAEGVELCRRPTGGGIVDHRHDWTYALVIPRGHPLEELRASDSYERVHRALAHALVAQGVPANVKLANEATPGDVGAASAQVSSTSARAGAPAGICFASVETFDVVNDETSSKIAGAAQKRNRHGLLFQGSVARAAVEKHAVDWEQFQSDFAAALGVDLGVGVEPKPWPEFNEEEVEALTERYSATEWNEFR